jgi:crossover junction endodeoxyribonuclease RuvC
MPPRTQAFPSPHSQVTKPLRRASSTTLRRAHRLQGMPVAQRVLGIDPGLHRTGYGLIDVLDGARGLNGLRLVEGGVLKARADDPFAQRLQTLFDGMTEVLEEHAPDAVVVEDLFSTYSHPRTAILMGHARGVLLLAAQRAMCPVHSFLPTEVKQVVAGNGHASKTSVQQAVRARLRLAAPPNPPDVADALAIAICFALRQASAADVATL